MTTFARLIANILMATMILFLVHRYFMFWHAWPNFAEALAGISGSNTDVNIASSYGVIAGFAVAFAAVTWHSFARRAASLMDEADQYAGWSAYIIRFAFWSVFLIGFVDTAISALRVENALIGLVGKSLDIKIGLASFRGLYIHYPLLVLSLVIAGFTRNLSVIWLAFLVVMAEFTIVITRFVFSYEQAYMGDLVRFWYAALFLFASAYTFIEEGHVRVDVIYANMNPRSKAWVNTIGCLVLGIPLCFTILLTGLGSKFSSISSPIINFEISQSGYGLYVKYLMAGFLLVFAVSMTIQFISYFLKNAALLLGDERAKTLHQGGH